MTNFKKNLLINVVFILLILIFGIFLINYFSNLISTQVEEIVKNRQNITLYTKSLSNLAQLKEVAPQVEVYQQKLDLLLPSKDNLIDLSRWINNVAKSVGVAVNFSFMGGGANATDKEAGYENFSINVRGSLSNIEKFFYNIERISPNFLLAIDDFSISKIDQNNYELRGNGRAFFK